MSTIKTNNYFRTMLYENEIPKKVLDDYHHLINDDKGYGWIKYKGRYYHITDFMRIQNNEDMKNWDAYISDSYFSGIVIKILGDNDLYKIGTYYS